MYVPPRRSSSSMFRSLNSRTMTGIGQCVGARNHRYFVLFLAWALLFCAWIFASLLALNVRGASSTDRNIDPQHIAIIALYVPPSCLPNAPGCRS